MATQTLVGARVLVLPRGASAYPTDELIESMVGAVGEIRLVLDDAFYGPNTLQLWKLKPPSGSTRDVPYDLYVPFDRAKLVEVNMWMD